jgi:hypothetical protein
MTGFRDSALPAVCARTKWNGNIFFCSKLYVVSLYSYMLKAEDKKALLFSRAGKDAASRRIKILVRATPTGASIWAYTPKFGGFIQKYNSSRAFKPASIFHTLRPQFPPPKRWSHSFFSFLLYSPDPLVSPTRLRGTPNLPGASCLARHAPPPAQERFEEEGQHSGHGGAGCTSPQELLQRRNWR